MSDQATQLRKLVREAVATHGDLAPGVPVVAITGAQPAVGVTTASCALARELAQLGKQVTLIDANLTAPAAAQRFEAKPPGTLAQVLAGRRRAIEALATTKEGIRLLAGADPKTTLAPPQLNAEALAHFASELSALCRLSDVVLIDAGAGMNPWIDRLWQVANHVLLIAAPNSAAILDAYSAVKQSHHEALAGKLQLVLTRCDRPADAARLNAGFADTCERFLGHAVKPPAVLPTLAPDDDQPFHRSLRLLAADLAVNFRALATRIPARRELPIASREATIPHNRATAFEDPASDAEGFQRMR